MVLSPNQLYERDANRDIGSELLTAILDVKAGFQGEVHQVRAVETVIPYGGRAPMETKNTNQKRT